MNTILLPFIQLSLTFLNCFLKLVKHACNSYIQLSGRYSLLYLHYTQLLSKWFGSFFFQFQRFTLSSLCTIQGQIEHSDKHGIRATNKAIETQKCLQFCSKILQLSEQFRLGNILYLLFRIWTYVSNILLYIVYY